MAKIALKIVFKLNRFSHKIRITPTTLPACVSGFGLQTSEFEFWVSGLSSRVSGFGFRVSGFGFRVPDFGFQVSGVGSRVSGFGFRVSSLGFRVSDFGFRVLGHRDGRERENQTHGKGGVRWCGWAGSWRALPEVKGTLPARRTRHIARAS